MKFDDDVGGGTPGGRVLSNPMAGHNDDIDGEDMTDGDGVLSDRLTEHVSSVKFDDNGGGTPWGRVLSNPMTHMVKLTMMMNDMENMATIVRLALHSF